MKVSFVSYTLLPTLYLDVSDDPLAEISEADYFAREGRAMAAARRVPLARRLALMLDRLVPAALRARWLHAREERMLHDTLARLAETSPHLLADIGMEPTAAENLFVEMDPAPQAATVTAAEPAPKPRQSRIKQAPARVRDRQPRPFAPALAP